jgi:DNA polymerase
MMDRGIAMDAKLKGQVDLAGFRAEARQLLAHQVPPDEVHWQLGAIDQYDDAQSPLASRPRNVARAATAIVPASFSRLCECVVMHRDTGRFALLYRLLWRLVHEPALRTDPLDADMAQAQHMAHAVRRDLHKMKSNLRLRGVHLADGSELQAGCHEPAHHVVEAAAAALARRIPSLRWAIFTPDRSVCCEQGMLHFGPGVPAAEMPDFEGPEQAWRDCHERVFAPQARAVLHA